MAKEKPKGGTALAAPATGGGALAVHSYGKDFAGMGFDKQTSADVAIPFLQLLQSNSPQCEKISPHFLKDARPGMFFNSVSKALYDGEKGVIVQPVDTAHVFGEWVPRDKGGGFRGVHQIDSPIVAAAKAKASGKVAGKLPLENGNDLVETFQIYGRLLADLDSDEGAEGVLIPFASTKIKKYRQAMYRLRMVKGDAPLFAHRVRLVAVPEKNAKGSFFNVEILPARDSVERSMITAPADGEQPHPLLVSGLAFLKGVRGGLIKADYQSATEDGREPGSDDHF